MGGTSEEDKVYFKVLEIECFEVETIELPSIPYKIGEESKKLHTNLFTTETIEQFLDLMSKELEGIVGLERVYSGIIDGFEPSTYHDSTDTIAKKIIVIKNEYGTVFGGYYSVALKSVTDKWINDPTAFIFQFSPEQQIFRTKDANGHHAFYKNLNKICEFSNDIEISANCNENKLSFAKPERYTMAKGRDLVGSDSNEDKVFFKVTDIEVFKLDIEFALDKVTKINDDFSLRSSMLDDNFAKPFIDLMKEGLKMDDEEIKLERVWCGLKDGFDAESFHAGTDMYFNRIFLLKNNLGTMFGGFVTKACNDIPDKWLDDPKAYLYQFNPESKIFRPKEDNGMI